MYKYLSLLVCCVIFLAFGCNSETQFEKDRRIIREYLETNNLRAESHPTGLYYNILDIGGNVNPNVTNTVEIRYKGTFLDGTVFDETQGQATAELSLTRVIRGWQIGVPLIGRGGKIELYIPSDLAYGRTGRGSIPANAVLYFEVELVDFD